MQLGEFDLGTKFVELDCGHTFEVEGMDQWLRSCVAGAGTGAIRLPECPSCKHPVRHTLRYGNFIKTTLRAIEEVKPRVRYEAALLAAERAFAAGEAELCYQALTSHPFHRYCAKAIDLLVKSAQNAAFTEQALTFLAKLPRSAGVLAGTARLTRSARGALISTASVKREAIAEADNMLKAASGSIVDAHLDECVCVAYMCMLLDDTPQANALLQRILCVRPRFAPALKLQEDFKTQKELVGIVMQSSGVKSGAWYRCPNGHLYCIGECGGAMERSKCPDCGVTVGGDNHTVVSSSSHSQVDGSSHAAWGNTANMANFDPNQLH